MRGLLNDQPESVELFWNATGNLSQVPTDRAQVTVHGPAGITDAACFQGAAGSRDQCSRNDVSGDSAVFEADGLGPREGLTVVVALPEGRGRAAADADPRGEPHAWPGASGARPVASGRAP